MLFDVYSYNRTGNIENSRCIIDWVLSDTSDIKCFQEYYNNSHSSVFNTASKMKESGYYAFPYYTFSTRKSNNNFGMAIFSRFPIIHTGSLVLKKNSHNSIIYTDLVIKGDTVRIINAHLGSMSINPNKILFSTLIHKMKKGFIARTLQVESLIEFINRSPYSVILCMDLNDTPYSFAYRKLNNLFPFNAFEYLGKGFGFTYNHPSFFFLRIDHQFYDEKFLLIKYDIPKMYFTDHFPIKSSYLMRK